MNLQNSIENYIVKENPKQHKRESGKIVTNLGLFDLTNPVSEEQYEKITHMKVFGEIMKYFDFTKFVNLEMLDVSRMDYVEIIDPIDTIRSLLYKTPTKTKPDDTELLKLYHLTKLKCLILETKSRKTISGEKFSDDYKFLENLPNKLEEIIIKNISSEYIKNLNIQNLPMLLKKISLYSLPIAKSVKLTNAIKEHIVKFNYPFGCKIFLDELLIIA